jgi:DNA adenine methylase
MSHNTTIQPLFKWAGSKQRMLKLYDTLILPPVTPERFIDLFAGGLTMSIWAYETFPNIKLVINDANKELVLLYKNLQTQPDSVIKEWRKHVKHWLTLNTIEDRKKYYYQLRTLYTQNYDTLPDYQKAGLLLFMLQTNFNGMWKTYLICNNLYSTPVGLCREKENFFKEEKIWNITEMLKNADIHSEDFANIKAQQGDFLYADPPYRATEGHYSEDFTGEDHTRLATHLTDSGNYYAYSNKNIMDGWYEKNFPNATIHPLNATYTAGRGKATHKVNEVLIINY